MSFDSVESAIILAAGRSQRFGAENKLLALWRGRALASYAIAAAAASKLRHIILVTGQDGDAIAALAADAKFTRAHNPDYQNGLSSSLQVGLAAAAEGPVIVLLADMPLVSAALIDDLLGAWRKDAYALVPDYNGQAGNPVILGSAARINAKSLTGDRGARRLFEDRRDVLRHPVSDPAVLRDFDSSADFSD